MLDIKYVRENLDNVIKMLENRRVRLDLSNFLQLEQDRRDLMQEVESLKAKRNQANETISELKKNKQDASGFIETIKSVSAEIKDLEPQITEIDLVLNDFMLSIPNMPHESVPIGFSAEDNLEIRKIGKIKEFDFSPLNHWEIGENLGILDFARASKIAGSRFVILAGDASRLNRALISFMLDQHTAKGYLELLPPFMNNSKAMYGTGQLPKFSQDLFKIENTDYWLIPTAEVPVTNLLSDEILEKDNLPLYYTAYTPCFRSEAGAAGRDTRGMIRLHQFDKVELVKFVQPQTAWDELEKLTADAESILQALELPYRVVSLCTADLGMASAKTYDLEVWLPGPGLYREISSCSCYTDYQARRAAIRYRPEKGSKTSFVYTLNGSGLAVGRTLVAIMENYQQADGSVIIPEVLRPYMGGKTKITAKV